MCTISCAYKVRTKRVSEIECEVFLYHVQPNNTRFLTQRGNEYQGCSVHDMPVSVVFIVNQRKNASKDNKKLTTCFSHKTFSSNPAVQICWLCIFYHFVVIMSPFLQKTRSAMLSNSCFPIKYSRLSLPSSNMLLLQ
jgi:hypothetical protein